MSKTKTTTVPSGAQRGVVVKWDTEHGYGFIRPNDAKSADSDVFVHLRNVEGRRALAPGQHASYHLTRTDKGLAAINVRPGSVLGTPYLRYTLIGVGSALLLLVGLAFALNRPASLALWLIMWGVALSITAFGIYGYDKGQAQRGGGRVPEVVLWLLAALGGSPGAFIAMRLFRHKTSKRTFQIVFWAIVLAQVALITFALLRR